MNYEEKKQALFEKYSEGTPFGDNFINLLHDLFDVLETGNEIEEPQ